MLHSLLRPNFHSHHFFFIHPHAPKLLLSNLPISTSLIMSYRPNYQGGGRRGNSSSSNRGGGRRGGGGGGRGGGGRGEQRWWDPVWRAERLKQQQAEVHSISWNTRHRTPYWHENYLIYFIENDMIECNYMCLFVRHIHLTLTPDMHSIRSVCASVRGVGATEV